MTPTIRAMTPADRERFREHFARHRAESAGQEKPFMPYSREGSDAPRGIDFEALERPLERAGWQRAFCAVAGDRIVGEVNLKGDGLYSGLHRCELGIGIEAPYRGQGLGRRLMETALEFARAAPSLEWVDLKVFGHNAPARALYRSLGFREIGTIEDRFRVDGVRVADVIMTLSVAGDET